MTKVLHLFFSHIHDTGIFDKFIEPYSCNDQLVFTFENPKSSAMFIGHFGAGMAAKKLAPRIPLSILFIAVQFLDLLWPTLLLMDVEHVIIKPGSGHAQPLEFTDYPVSHSLAMVTLWAGLFGLLYWLLKKDIRSALVIALCVVSHWFLDLLVHMPDLPLYPGNSPLLGFSLWNYKMLELIIELAIFFLGLMLYLKSTIAKNKWGNISLGILTLLLLTVQITNIFGPPPPEVSAIAWAGQLQWLFVFLAIWVDRTRNNR